MSALSANSDVLGCSMKGYSQIANVLASPDFRNSHNDKPRQQSQSATMTEEADKNGGPNHLAAWMRYRGIKGAALAKELGVTPGMISDLANSNRALSAKWLRRIAPALRTTPGMLLDHDPYNLDSDMIEIWIDATADQRKTLSDLARVIIRGSDADRNGTTG